MDEATGGPCAYAGNDMKVAHQNMAVTKGEFGALVEDLVATLDKFKVPTRRRASCSARWSRSARRSSNRRSTATGTALSAAFKPAPAAKKPMAKPMKKRHKM